MKTAMILAAGRGDRLRPLTDQIPKALCQVHGAALIEHHIISLADSGFEKIVINHAHLGGQIRQHLGNGNRFGADIVYSPEPPGGLETGGGIVCALPLLGEKPFLTVNADIYTDFNFSLLSLDELQTAHLVLVNKNATLGHHGDFGLVKGVELSNLSRDYTFSGIACYHPNLFTDYKFGRFSVTPMIRELAVKGMVTGQLYQGTWYDIGTQERLDEANGA